MLNLIPKISRAPIFEDFAVSQKFYPSFLLKVRTEDWEWDMVCCHNSAITWSAIFMH